MSYHRLWHSVWRKLPNIAEEYFTKTTRSFCLLVTHKESPVATIIFAESFEDADKVDSIIELRGYAISKDAPANTGSKALAKACRILKLRFPSVKKVTTYSFPELFKMTLYKGSSFSLIGVMETKSGLRVAKLERAL